MVAVGGAAATKLGSWRAPLMAGSNCFRCASGAARREIALAQVREIVEPTGGFEPPTC